MAYVEVDKDKLEWILRTFVDTFNDCSCCPLSFECKMSEQGISCYDCPDQLEKWLI